MKSGAASTPSWTSTCLGFDALGIVGFGCSPLNVGGGTSKMAHASASPVHAPATACFFVTHPPTYSSGVQKELVTPTGAAIIATVCDVRSDRSPRCNVSAIGYGAGTTDLGHRPNVVHMMIGKIAEKSRGRGNTGATRIRLRRRNRQVDRPDLDDMNPQIYGHFQERALTQGALDVYTTAVQMKKNQTLERSSRFFADPRTAQTPDGFNFRGDHHHRRAHLQRETPRSAARNGARRTA